MKQRKHIRPFYLAALLVAAGLIASTPGFAQWEKTAFVNPSPADSFFFDTWNQLPTSPYRRIYDVAFEDAWLAPTPNYSLSGTTIATDECYDSWVVGPMTGYELHEYLTISQTRLLDIELLDDSEWTGAGEAEYFAVVVRNVGSKAKGWWYYLGITEQDISTVVAQTGGRLIDLEYLGQEIDLYAAVLIANVGEDERDWFYGTATDSNAVTNLVAAHEDYRIVHIDFEGNGRVDEWNYIFERTDEIAEARVVFDRTMGQILAERDADKLRVTMLDRMFYQRYAAIFVNTKSQIIFP